MSKDGLVEKNLSQGTTERVSSRSVDESFVNRSSDTAIGRNAQKSANGNAGRQSHKQAYGGHDSPKHDNAHGSFKVGDNSQLRDSGGAVADHKAPGGGGNNPVTQQASTNVNTPHQSHSNMDAQQSSINKKAYQRDPERASKLQEHSDTGFTDKPKSALRTEKEQSLNFEDGRQRLQEHRSTASTSRETMRGSSEMKLQRKKARLQFADDVVAGKLQNQRPNIPLSSKAVKKLNARELKALKAEGKYLAAKSKLPTRRRLRFTMEANKGTGAAGAPRLSFEREIKPPNSKNPLVQGMNIADKALANITPLLVDKDSDDGSMELSEKGIGAVKGAGNATSQFKSRLKMKKHKRVERLEKKAIKKNTKFLYEKAKVQSRTFKASNPLNKMFQKRRIQKVYGAQLRKRGKDVVKAGGSIFAKVLKMLLQAVRSRTFLCIGAVCLLLVGFVSACMAAFSALGGGSAGGLTVGSWTANHSDIHDSELLWTELERQLEETIDNVPSSHSGYDEYRYEIGPIGHNAFELISYLSAVYQSYSFIEVEEMIQQLFSEMYVLSFHATTETKYDSDGDPYDWHVLTTKLTVTPFEQVIAPYLEFFEAESLYDLYMETYGANQMFACPLPFTWPPYVTSPYGYRPNPTDSSAGTEVHRGLDIGAAENTSIYAIREGTVTISGWSDSYGNYIVIQHKDGYESKYAHCNSLLVSAGAKVELGQEIALVGSTGRSTGPHLHIEILKDGAYLNPTFLLAVEPFANPDSDG